MKFKDYYNLFTESPDKVLFSIEGSPVVLNWNMYSANPFGFIDTESTFKFDEITYKFFNDINIDDNLLLGGSKQTHGDIVDNYIKHLNKGFIYIIDVYNDKLIKLDLTNTSLKNQIFDNKIQYQFPVNSHQILMPCGRIWTGLVKDGKKFNFISFWGSQKPITHEHIEQVLEFFNIPESEWNTVYLEFINETDNGNRLTFDKLKYNISDKHEDQKQFKSNSEMGHLAAGFGGLFKSKEGMGSISQGNKAKKAGYDGYAKYKSARFPYRESFE